MKRTIHDKLVDSIRFHTSNNENPVDTLIKIIPLSKEAAYRRLRGEIQFTLAEAVRISEKLGISLDNLIGIDKKSHYIFHIKQFFAGEPLENYYDLLQTVYQRYKLVQTDPDSLFYIAGNMLFPTFYFKYPNLSQYAFFKWFYQSYQDNNINTKLRDVIVPGKISSIQQKICKASMLVNSYFIVGNDIISVLANDIRYFVSIDMVSPEECAVLKKEILSMLDDMEKTTINAIFPATEKSAFIYISNAYFDGNYSYMSSTNFQASTIYLYGVNQLNCIDPAICENQKLWLESLIAHSSLISGSGRLYATDFFSHQRELVNTMLDFKGTI